jgi:hypothetical protein
MYVPLVTPQSDQKKRAQAEIKSFAHIPEGQSAGIKFRIYPNNEKTDVNQEMFFEYKPKPAGGTTFAAYAEPDGQGEMGLRVTYAYSDGNNETKISKKLYDFKIKNKTWIHWIINVTTDYNGNNGEMKFYARYNEDPEESDLIWHYKGSLGLKDNADQAQIKTYKFIWNSKPEEWQASKDIGITYREYLYDDFEVQDRYYTFDPTEPPIEPPPVTEDSIVFGIIIDTLRIKILNPN